jgi:hypothetical protein
MQRAARRIALLLLVAAVPHSALDRGQWRRSIGNVSNQPVYDSVKAALQLLKPAIAKFGSDKCVGGRELNKILDAVSVYSAGALT